MCTSNKISCETKISIYCIGNVALFESKTWALGTEEKKRLISLELWCYRKMPKQSWGDRVANKEVYERAAENIRC